MKYLPTLILVFVCFTASAQDSSITVFSLQQCVDVSLKNNIQLKQNELNVETANISKKLANEARLPTLNASATPGYNIGRTVDPTTNQFIDNRYLQSSFSINSSVILFNGFRLNNVIKQNKYSTEAVQFELKDFKNTLILNVLTAYVQILYNKEALKNAENQLTGTEAQKLRTEKLVKGGVLPESNFLDLKSKAANDESSVVIAENQLNIAKLNLIQYMNLPLENYAIEQIDIETPAFTDITNITETPSEIYIVAEKTQPAIRGAELRLKSSQFALTAAKGNMYPRLTLNGSIYSYYSELNRDYKFVADGTFAPSNAFVNINGENTPIYQPSGRNTIKDIPLFDQLGRNRAQSISLSLIIPIYGNRQARAVAENANVTRKNAELNFQNSKVQLRKKIEQAFVDAKAAQKKYDATQEQVLANEEAFRVTEKRFNAGVINSVDYTISSNTLNQSRSTLIQSKYDLILKKKILEFYKYNDLQF